MGSRAGSGRRGFEAGCGAGCLVAVVGGLTGVGSWWLGRAAVRTCGVYLSEWPDPLSLRFWELPLSIGAGLAVAVAAYVLAGARARTAVAVLVTVVVLGLLAWGQFAWLGTPAGAGVGDRKVCTDSNVPPWWPSWVPA